MKREKRTAMKTVQTTVHVQEIRAGRIVLEDESGKDRIVMEMIRGQPSIKMIGLDSNPQVFLEIAAVQANSAELRLCSPDGKTIGMFTVNGEPSKEGTATLLFGGRGKKRIVASTNLPTLPPSLTLTDETGKVIAQLPPTAAPSRDGADGKARSKALSRKRKK